MTVGKFISYDVEVKGYIEVAGNRIGIDFHAASDDVNKPLHSGLRNLLANLAGNAKYDVRITGKVKFEGFGEIDIDKEFKN